MNSSSFKGWRLCRVHEVKIENINRRVTHVYYKWVSLLFFYFSTQSHRRANRGSANYLRLSLDTLDIISFILLGYRSKRLTWSSEISFQVRPVGEIYKGMASKSLNAARYLLGSVSAFMAATETPSSFVSLCYEQETVRLLSFSIIGHQRKDWDQKANSLAGRGKQAYWHNGMSPLNALEPQRSK